MIFIKITNAIIRFTLNYQLQKHLLFILVTYCFFYNTILENIKETRKFSLKHAYVINML